MTKAALLASALALAGLLCSCSTSGEFKPEEGDKLTEAETAALTSHARNFIAKNKRIRLSDAEREYIRTTPPETFVKYTDTKEGQLSFTWQVSDERRFIINLDGKLISESRQAWEIQIITTGKPIFMNNKPPAPTDKQPQAGDAKTP